MASIAVVLVLGANPNEQASFQRPEIERHLCRSRKRAGAMARHGDDRHRQHRQRGQQPNDFLRFSAVRED